MIKKSTIVFLLVGICISLPVAVWSLLVHSWIPLSCGLLFLTGVLMGIRFAPFTGKWYLNIRGLVGLLQTTLALPNIRRRNQKKSSEKS